MGFKEGWSEGRRVAEKVYWLSTEFPDPHDPRLGERIVQAGITPKQVANLTGWPAPNKEDIGFALAALIFSLRHGL